MLLDTPTVNLVTALMIILECGILITLWAIHRDIAGVRHWAAGAIAMAVGVFGIYLRPVLPPVLSITVSNMAIVYGYLLTWWGLELFFDRRPRYLAGLILLVLSAAGLAYFSLLDNNTRIRLILMLSAMALLSGLRARSLLRDVRPETRVSQIFGGTIFVLQTLGILVLLAAAFLSPSTPGPLGHIPVSGWIFLFMLMLSVAAVFAAVLLVNQKLQARLLEAALRDSLTGALRRRALEEAAGREIARSLRHHRPLGLLVLDLDHFKLINDQYGHHAGDEALRRFAMTCRDCLRQEDLFGRTGGEEFCILLPDTDCDGTKRLAERVRMAVDTMDIDAGGPHVHLTVSIGAAMLSDHDNTWDSLTRTADVALYQAKSAGRNRIAVADPPPNAARSVAE